MGVGSPGGGISRCKDPEAETSGACWRGETEEAKQRENDWRAGLWCGPRADRPAHAGLGSHGENYRIHSKGGGAWGHLQGLKLGNDMIQFIVKKAVLPPLPNCLGKEWSWDRSGSRRVRG